MSEKRSLRKNDPMTPLDTFLTGLVLGMAFGAFVGLLLGTEIWERWRAGR